MCKKNKELFFILLLGVLSVCLAGALRAEEQGPWYLISHQELQSIEQYRAKSEAEKRNWQLQVRSLSNEADVLRQDSTSLNSQLANQRQWNRNLEQSFNEYEAESLTAISQKNGEIAALKKEVAEQALALAKAKGLNVQYVTVIIAMTAVIVLFACAQIYRKLRPV